MAIAFVLGANTDGSTTQVTGPTINIPAHDSGDLLVAFTSSTRGETPFPAIATPSGWTKENDVEAGAASAIRLTCFTKIGDGDASAVTMGLAVEDDFSCSAVVLAFSGAEQAIDASDDTVDDNINDITCPSVTTTVANTVILYAYNQDDDLSSITLFDDDVGFNGTNRGFGDLGSGGGGNNGQQVGVSSEAQAAIGASNTCVMNMNDTDAACAMTIAIAPIAAGGAEPNSLTLLGVG